MSLLCVKWRYFANNRIVSVLPTNRPLRVLAKVADNRRTGLFADTEPFINDKLIISPTLTITRDRWSNRCE